MLQKLRIRLLLISSIVLVVALSVIALLTWSMTGRLMQLSYEIETTTEQSVDGAEEQVVERISVINALNRSIWFGILIVGLVALMLITLLTYRALKPVESLTKAIQHITNGNTNQQVPVRSGDEIGELTRAFNQMAATLQAQESLRRNLMNDVAHELRSPLANIQCQLEAVQDALLEPSPALIDSLHAEIMLLKKLVGDLQDLALAEADKLTLHRRSVELSTLVEKAICAVSPAAQHKQMQIIFTPPKTRTTVLVDANRMQQVIRNLLDNAIQHTPAQGQISIVLEHERHRLTLRVIDSGPGIEAEHLPHLFDRFYRGDPSRSRTTGGAGLGLAIAKQLVEAHAGRIWVENNRDAGATFLVSLPVEP